jgi:hypothetical protein
MYDYYFYFDNGRRRDPLSTPHAIGYISFILCGSVIEYIEIGFPVYS